MTNEQKIVNLFNSTYDEDKAIINSDNTIKIMNKSNHNWFGKCTNLEALTFNQFLGGFQNERILAEDFDTLGIINRILSGGCVVGEVRDMEVYMQDMDYIRKIAKRNASVLIEKLVKKFIAFEGLDLNKVKVNLYEKYCGEYGEVFDTISNNMGLTVDEVVEAFIGALSVVELTLKLSFETDDSYYDIEVSRDFNVRAFVNSPYEIDLEEYLTREKGKYEVVGYILKQVK